jgi:hypothetical protein
MHKEDPMHDKVGKQGIDEPLATQSRAREWCAVAGVSVIALAAVMNIGQAHQDTSSDSIRARKVMIVDEENRVRIQMSASKESGGHVELLRADGSKLASISEEPGNGVSVALATGEVGLGGISLVASPGKSFVRVGFAKGKEAVDRASILFESVETGSRLVMRDGNGTSVFTVPK